jgi:hypothetical protein
MEITLHIFKPRYPVEIRLAVILMPLLFFVLLFSAAFSITILPMSFWVLIFSLGVISSLVPFFIIREIRFLDELVVRRHFLPDIFIPFEQIVSFENTIMLSDDRKIRLGKLGNLVELNAHFQRWKAAKLLKGSQSHPDPVKSLYPQRGYGSYASFWGLIFGVLFTSLAPPGFAIDPRWLLAGSFLLVYFIYIYIIPRII